jgi:hypothetical protein
MPRVRFIIGLFILLGLLSCEVPFDPKGDFLNRVVVFGVLSPQKTVHVVRISTTYDPPEFDPLGNTNSNQVSNATVTITVNAVATTLRDSAFQRTDTGRYQDSIRAFVYTPGSIQRGVPYSLSADVPGYGTLTATTTPPSQGIIEIESSSRPTLTNPDVNRTDVMFFAIPANNAEGHAIRVFLEYEVPTLSPGVLVREEVPLFTTNYQDCLTFDAVYPQVRRRQQVAGREIWMLPHLSYQRAILKIIKSHEGHVVNFKRVVVAMIQADKHLYSYFSLVGGFRDEFSIRVDEPNYSNIDGGLGFFGSFTADSLSVTLPLGFPNITCP